MSIKFDAGSSVAFATGTSRTLSHTCGTGFSRYLVVFVRLNNNSDAITGVTYNGVAMTQLLKYHETVGNSAYNYVYGLANPSSGANNIVASAGSSVTIALFGQSYSGVSPVGQPDATATGSISDNPSLTTSITTVADNCWVVGQYRNYNSGGEAAGTNVTARTTRVDGGISGDYGPKTPAGSISLTFTGNSGVSGSNTMLVSLLPSTLFVDSLVSYWKLDEASGNAIDIAGGHTGVNTNVTYDVGKIKNGAIFNGNAKLTCPSSSISTGNMTISFWAKHNGNYPAAGEALISKIESGVVNGFTIEADTYNSRPNTMSFFGWNAAGYVGSCGMVYDNKIADNKWHMFTVTYNATTKLCQGYNDGVFYADATFSAAITYSTASLLIGQSEDTYWGKLTGGMDEVGIWDRVLTPTEIMILYKSGMGQGYPFSQGPSADFFQAVLNNIN